MATNVNDQNALTDNQGNRALLGHSGTAGTATTIRLVANAGGGLVSNGLDIAKGNVTGHTYYHKFGLAPDFDTEDNAVDVWDGANDGLHNLMTHTYSTTADIDSLSSSNNGDTQTIVVEGLDTNWNYVTQTLTLTGNTRKALSTDLIRVFRVLIHV